MARLPDAAPGANRADHHKPCHHDDRPSVIPAPGAGDGARWDRLAGGPRPADIFVDQFRYVVYQDPDWDWRNFDLERDSARANAVDKDIDELDPHLAAFAKHGGKLLIYHGWADQQVAPGSSIEFYESVRQTQRRFAQGAELDPSFHGARYGALHRWRRP